MPLLIQVDDLSCASWNYNFRLTFLPTKKIFMLDKSLKNLRCSKNYCKISMYHEAYSLSDYNPSLYNLQLCFTEIQVL